MDNQKSTYGLIGYPLSHSLSPLMHNAAFEALGVDACYKLFPLQEDALAAFFENLRKEDSAIFGLNVTVPYKEKVLKYIDKFSPYAKKIKAVNTIVITNDRKLVGYNTDGPGFLAHLADLGFSTEGKRIAIVGAGGAARAIISSLCLLPERPYAVKVFDIDRERAQFLLTDLGESLDVSIAEIVGSIDDLNIEINDLLINATPIGMKKDDPCLIDPEMIHKDLLVYDLIYNPAETFLLKTAKEKGARTANGLGMLFYQGVLAFQHWADIQLKPAVKAKMKESLEKGLMS